MMNNKKQNPLSCENGFLLSAEPAVTEASLRSLLRNLRILCPFCFAKAGLCGFDYRCKFIRPEHFPCRLVFGSVLVEPAVIETASENLSPQLSTSVVYLLSFPSRTADKQALRYGILLFMAKAEKLFCHVHC